MTSTTITIGIALLVLHVLFAAYVLWRARHPRLIRVCCKCKRQLRGTSNYPVGEPLPIAPNQSHGIGVCCVRKWGEELGLSEKDINELEASAKKAA